MVFRYPTSDTRYKYPTDINELRRRWKVTREAMAKEGIDCIVMANNGPLFGGMVKYLTDCPVPLYPLTAFFARDPEQGIGIFAHGAWGGVRIPPYACNEGIRDNIAVPYLPSMNFTDDYLGIEAVKVAKRNGYKKMGWYGMNTIPTAFYLYLKENLPGVEFVDATDMLDHIKAVKSEYEIELWTKCVEIHDQLMAAVPCLLRPGLTEKELSDSIIKMAMDFDCESFNIMVGADPLNPVLHNIYFQNQVIKEGDGVQLLIEVSAPTDIWAECGRMFSIGEPAKELKKACDDSILLQGWVAEKSVPGADPVAIYKELNVKLKEMGYLPENRLFAHGQTYDIVDRPIYAEGETMILQENMFVALHPTCATKRTACYNCDNFVIKKGGAQRLSKTPLELFVV